jgi:putative nucleotidyltransferase with HDIG domain
MMKYSKNEAPIHIAIILFLLFYCYNFILLPSKLIETPRLSTDDFFSGLSRLLKKPPEEINDITVVAIDDDSLFVDGLRWQWKRSIFADLITALDSYGPKAIFLDIGFMGKSEEAQDAALAEAIKNSGNVILASYVDERGKHIRPIEMLSGAAAQVGVVNQILDKDLKVRRMRGLFLLDEEKSYTYGVSVLILAFAKHIDPARIRNEPRKIILSPQIEIPVDRHGWIPINYSARKPDFITIPAYKIIKHHPIDESLIKDKIVMVGTTANITHDIHLTPLGRIPGVYINAINVLMLLSGNYLKTLPPWIGIAVLFLFTFLCGFLSFRLRPAYSTLVMFTFLITMSAVYLFLGISYNFRMDIFGLLFLCAVSYLCTQIYKYVSLIVESEKLKREAILDSSTALFTQRYLQLTAQSLLKKNGKNPAHFFCMLHINEFALLREKNMQAISELVKMVSQMIKVRFGENILLARYGEDALSLCILNISRTHLEKSFSSLIDEISNREFVLGEDSLRITVRAAALDFPRENINSYEDMALTCEALLRRAGEDVLNPLAVFDPKKDRLVRAGRHAVDMTYALPKSELGYVRMDLAARNKELEIALEALRQQEKKVEQHYFHTMHSLIKALEEKDPYTAGHSERVGFYATELAKGLNLPKDEIEAVNRAAYLHDIGKIGLPDRILHKRGKLTEDEFEFIKRHQTSGAKILEGLPFYEQVVPYVLYHHERYDGKGYPHGLSGDMIPIGAQIIAIADAFDAMTTGRGYNNPLGMVISDVIAELRRCSGTQFNPAYVNRFIELLEQKKIHTLPKTAAAPSHT